MAELKSAANGNERKEWGQSSLLTPVMRERVPVNRRRISQNFSAAGLSS